MNLKPAPGRLLAAAIVVLSVWIVHDFVEALLAACVIAIASWPLYAAFRPRLPSRVGKSAGAAMFTGAITVFVLAPMLFASWALLSETHALLLGLAAADSHGLGVPEWLANAPVVGPGWPHAGKASSSTRVRCWCWRNAPIPPHCSAGRRRSDSSRPGMRSSSRSRYCSWLSSTRKAHR